MSGETRTAGREPTLTWIGLRDWLDKASDDIAAQQSYEWRSIKLDHYARKLDEAVAARVAEAERELEGYRRWQTSVDEALNSGDGSYQP